MSESSMWGTLRPYLHGWDPVRVENKIEKGTPDVNYLHGWIELKWKRRQPRDPKSQLRLDHGYSIEQRVWAIRREHVGGKVFVMVKIGKEWLLFKGSIAAEFLEKTSLIELRKVALGRWEKKLNEAELRKHLASA